MLVPPTRCCVFASVVFMQQRGVYDKIMWEGRGRANVGSVARAATRINTFTKPHKTAHRRCFVLDFSDLSDMKPILAGNNASK